MCRAAMGAGLGAQLSSAERALRACSGGRVLARRRVPRHCPLAEVCLWSLYSRSGEERHKKIARKWQLRNLSTNNSFYQPQEVRPYSVHSALGAALAAAAWRGPPAHSHYLAHALLPPSHACALLLSTELVYVLGALRPGRHIHWNKPSRINNLFKSLNIICLCKSRKTDKVKLTFSWFSLRWRILKCKYCDF